MLKSFSGNAVPTRLLSGITIGAMEFTLQDYLGWPDGSAGPFVATLSRGAAAEEKVLCSARTAGTVTIQQRGYDGTAPAAHPADATCIHTIDAATIREANAHSNTPQDAAHDERYLVGAGSSAVAGVPYGVVIEGAGTNLVTNPSFEVNTAGWVVYGTGSTIARDTVAPMVGAARLKVTIDSTAGGWAGVRSDPIPVAAGNNYTFSYFVKTGAAPNFRAQIHWIDAAGANVGAFPTLDVMFPSGGVDWTRYSVGGAAPAGAVNAVLYLVNNNVVQGIYDMYFDGMQLEQAARPSTYIDGSLGPGYAWTGTAHASTSTRSAGTKVLSNRSRLDVDDLYVRGVAVNGFADALMLGGM